MKRAIMSQYKQIKVGNSILGTKMTEDFKVYLFIRVDYIDYIVMMEFPTNYPLVQPILTCLSKNRKYEVGEKICLGTERKDTIMEYIHIFMSKTMTDLDKFDIKKNIIEDNIKELSAILFD